MPVARVKHGPKRSGEEYMTLFQRDLENQEIGREEGRKEGKKEGQKELIEGMLRKGKTPQAIADFCRLPLQFVLDIQSSIHPSAVV